MQAENRAKRPASLTSRIANRFLAATFKDRNDEHGPDFYCGVAALFVGRMNRDGSNGPESCRASPKPGGTFRKLITTAAAPRSFSGFRSRSLLMIHFEYHHLSRDVTGI